MARTITVSALNKLCEEQIKNGNGKKKILISSDDEGNGFHELFYAFSAVDGLFDGKYPPSTPYGVDERNIHEYIILG